MAPAQRRLTEWVASAEQGEVGVATNASVIVQSNATLFNTTIVRTRGILSVRPTVEGVSLFYQGALGMGIVSDQAFAAGAGSVPGPWTDQDWGGWFVWIAFVNRLSVSTDIGRELISINIPFDSKAMRKVEPNETVVVVVESQVGAVNVATPFRMLIKLP